MDSNVILDIVTGDPQWAAWSAAMLTSVARSSTLVINPIVYAEVSVKFDTIETLEVVLPPDLYRREPLPYAAAFLAGKSFIAYRQAGGSRTAPLPDFFVGAHAAVAGYRLLTRDARRYRTYFPRLELITPPRT